MTTIELCMTFSSDDTCRELLERLRWPNGPVCPRCCNPNPARLANSSKLIYCKDCDYQFTVTVNTIFHNSHLPLIKWLTATFLLCETRKGMSHNEIKRTLEVSYKTAWYLCHRIRAAMALAEKNVRFKRRNSKALFLDTLQHMITADPLTYERLTD